MLTQQTLGNLRLLKLKTMADVYQQQLDLPAAQAQSFDERLARMVDNELSARTDRKLQRLIKAASLPEPVLIEDLEFSAQRGLDSSLISSLASGEWIRRAQNVVVTGATGTGKTWTLSALATQACRQEFQTLYLTAGDLYDLLTRASLDGTWAQTKRRLIGYAVLIIDDLGMAPISSEHAHVLLDVIDKRMRKSSLVIASQYPISAWHGFFPDPTMADAVLDRIVHSAHEIALKGESFRKLRGKDRLQRKGNGGKS